MRSVGEALAELGAARRERLTPDDLASVEDVLDGAAAWAARELPLHAFARLGDINRSSAYARLMALICAAPDDPRRAALLRAIDALLVEQGNVMTTHGMFSGADLGEAGVVVRWREAA